MELKPERSHDMSQTNTPNTPPLRKQPPLPQIACEEIREPGAYVELETGALYRVPRESLAGGAFPLIERGGDEGPQPVRADKKPSRRSQFVRVSGNPHIFSLAARMLCVNHDIHPRF